MPHSRRALRQIMSLEEEREFLAPVSGADYIRWGTVLGQVKTALEKH